MGAVLYYISSKNYYIFKSNLFYQQPKYYFWKHLPLKSVLVRGWIRYFYFTVWWKAINLTSKTLYVLLHGLFVSSSSMLPWQVCQFSNYWYRHMLSEDQSALKQETWACQAIECLQPSTVSLLSGGLVIHNRFLWNMVNKWSDIIMSASIGMTCILFSVLNGDLQSINNESLEKYFILQFETHLIIPVPSTISQKQFLIFMICQDLSFLFFELKPLPNSFWVH